MSTHRPRSDHHVRSQSNRRADVTRCPLQVERLEDRTLLTTIFAMTPGNVLIRFDSATPGQVTTVGAVTGVGTGETIRGIDFRPRTGQLFAGTVVTGSANNSTLRTYSINPLTAQATRIGAGVVLSGAGDVPTGYDFNPTLDRIRLVNTNDENARLNPANGARADVPTNDTDLNPAATSEIIAEAYDRNFDRQAITTPTNNNAIPTTLYAINRATSTLARQGGINGTPNPNAGAITAVGPLGFVLSATHDGGFDISPGGIAYAALTNAADNLTSLYTINLQTGLATSLGLIGNGATQVFSIAAVIPTNLQVAGADAGAGIGGRVKILNPLTGTQTATFRVFGPSFSKGVRVATGDVNGDSISDVIVAAGPGAPSMVQVIDGSKLEQVRANRQIRPSAILGSFLALAPGSLRGLFVAAGDVNGDGRADIIVSAATGNSRVKVIDGSKINQVDGNGRISASALLGSFFAYPPGFAGGVTVGAGDVNGDGRTDIITGMATRGSQVKIIDGTKLNQVDATGRIADTALLSTFLAFRPRFRSGVFVAGGDVTGDGRADIVASVNAASMIVKVVDANKLTQINADGRISDSALKYSFQAFPDPWPSGVRVGALEGDLDGLDDLIVGAGDGEASIGLVLRGSNLGTLSSFDGFFGAQVFVGGS